MEHPTTTTRPKPKLYLPDTRPKPITSLPVPVTRSPVPMVGLGEIHALIMHQPWLANPTQIIREPLGDLANKVSARWRHFIAGYEGGTTLAHCPTVTHRYYRYLRKRGITLKRSMLHALFAFVLDHLGTLNVGSADLPERIRDRLQMRDALRGYHKQRIKVAAVRHRTRFDDNRWETRRR